MDHDSISADPQTQLTRTQTLVEKCDREILRKMHIWQRNCPHLCKGTNNIYRYFTNTSANSRIQFEGSKKRLWKADVKLGVDALQPATTDQCEGTCFILRTRTRKP